MTLWQKLTASHLKQKNKEKSEVMEKLLKEGLGPNLPQINDLVTGKIIALSKNEIHLDIDGVATGVVRGKEIFDEGGAFQKLKIGDEITATVLELENENGELELSLRSAGHQQAWDNLKRLKNSGEIVEVKVMDANRGGLIIKINNIFGFLPVSQLATEHYPRVEGGDKNKILSHLREFIGQNLRVKIIDTEENEDKLIVSEKAALEEKQISLISKYKVGEVIEGRVTAVVDFGAFVEFGDNLEGLVHISELAWQRIDDPRDFIKIGDKVKAEIIEIEGAKISLSMKKLIKDPWQEVEKKYKIGQLVKGKILKTNPFGAFVELDKDIHGLVHISEFAETEEKKSSVKKPFLEIGKTHEFKIISLEPKEHRLGLSLKATKTDTKKKNTAKQERSEEKEKKREE